MNKKYLFLLVPVFFVVWILIGNYLVCPMTSTWALAQMCTQEEAFYASLSYSVLFMLPLMVLIITNNKYLRVVSIIVIILFLILSFGTLLFGFRGFDGGNYLIRYFYLGLADPNKLGAWAIYILPTLGLKISM